MGRSVSIMLEKLGKKTVAVQPTALEELVGGPKAPLRRCHLLSLLMRLPLYLNVAAGKSPQITGLERRGLSLAHGPSQENLLLCWRHIVKSARAVQWVGSIPVPSSPQSGLG